MNELTRWLDKYKGDMSIRQLAAKLNISHAYLAKVFRQESPITWAIAAKVAENTDLDYMSAFRLAGLLKENGDASPSSVETSPLGESHEASIAHAGHVVTIGAGQ